MKRTLSMILVCAMVLALLSVIPFSVAAGDNTGPGDVEPDHPTEGLAINTAEEFAAMTADGNYYLAADITLTSTWGLETTTDEAGAVVNTITAFKGTLDGNGKTVTVAAPMFAKVEGATIKNLNVVGAINVAETTPYVIGSNDFVAAVAVIASGESTFQNIVSDVDITATSANTRAASIAAASEAGSVITILDCVNNGDISVVKYAGGIYGWSDKGVTSYTIANCVNNGNVTASAGYVGGVINRLGSTATVATVENCVNNGAVAGTTHVAGIVAYNVAGLTITSCENYGKITNFGEETARVAGIIAQSTTGKNILVVDRCYNAGEIVASGDSAGGIAAKITVNKYNESGPDVTAAEGGFMFKITNCVNAGTVSGVKCVAGILGRSGDSSMYGSMYISGCINTGNIKNTDAAASAANGYASGIYAYGSTSNNVAERYLEILNCVTTGNIESAATNGGASYFAGYVNNNTSIVKNCYAMGTLTGANNVAIVRINSDKTFAPENVAGTMIPADFADVIVSENAAAADATRYYKLTDATPVFAIGTLDTSIFASGKFVYDFNQAAGENVMYMIIDGTNFAPTPIYYVNQETGDSNEVILEEGVYKNRVVVLTVNYDALNAAIAEVEALKEADYTAETWAALKTALDAAKAATTAATQAEVDAAAAALVAAKAALVELPKPDLVTVTTAAGVSTTYKSLAEASAALADGDTIKLVGDVTAEETLTISKSVTVDGDGKTLTSTAGVAIQLKDAVAATVTIKNITIVASKRGIVLAACADAASKSTLTLTDINVTANGGEGFDGEAYWDYTVTNCNFTGSTHAFDNSGNGYNNVTITGGTFIGKSGYGLYFRNYSVITIKDATITSNGSSGIQMITAKSTEAGSKLTLTGTTNITSTSAYCVAVNPFNQLFIEGGTYKASAKDACINVNGYGSYAKITDGYFECSQNCAIRVYFSGDVTGDLPVLDIHGGTFVYNNAEGGGSALRAGTGGANGIANIYGGKFVSNGNAAPVLNTVRDDGVINIVACTVENNGPSTIAVYGKYYDGAVSVIDAFPAGATTAEYADGKLVGGEQGGDETTVGGGDETTVPGGDETTTVPGGDETTTVPGDDETTTTPQDTEPTDDTGCGGCGGIAVAAQLVAIVCGVLGFAVIKKKN